ncbi:MAG: hypothetical protein IKT39_04025 [Clostridia bacterium]|nr:hypothetical protein [Clostridia bacterium]
MKSNICELNKDLSCLEAVLAEVEKVTTYNGLEDKKALRLRLLAEELCGMLPGLVENFSGDFWAENDGDNYELHVELKAEDMTFELRDELISVSKSGKNAAAKGVMGKIRAVAETMLLAAFDPTVSIPTGEYYDYHGYNMGFGYIDPTIAARTGYIYSWSLYSYKAAVEENEEDAYAELERSIVAKLADDIIVGVRGNNVEIVVKKSF